MGWLNELAFAPVDYAPGAAVDEWSQDRGVGARTSRSSACSGSPRQRGSSPG